MVLAPLVPWSKLTACSRQHTDQIARGALNLKQDSGKKHLSSAYTGQTCMILKKISGYQKMLPILLLASMAAHCRIPELPEEEMTPGRWNGASLRGPKRSTSREELRQVIAEISGKRSGSNGDESAPAQQAPAQAPIPSIPELQVG